MPYLARGKQSEELKRFCESHHPDAKGDIATVFVSRFFRWLGDHGTQAAVTPQNWLFLTTYRKLRERLLSTRTWKLTTRLGAKAFQTPMWDFNVMLNILSADRPQPNSQVAGIDVSVSHGQRHIKAAEKARLLADGSPIVGSIQADQLKNPDSVVLMRPVGDRTLLGEVARSLVGFQTGDDPRYCLAHHELQHIDGCTWELIQNTHPCQKLTTAAKHGLIRWEQGQGALFVSPECYAYQRLGCHRVAGSGNAPNGAAVRICVFETSIPPERRSTCPRRFHQPPRCLGLLLHRPSTPLPCASSTRS